MKAKDVMSKDVVSVSASAPMREIYNVLKKTRYGGIPVVDKDKKILGMITKTEILAVFLPDYFDMLGVARAALPLTYRSPPNRLRRCNHENPQYYEAAGVGFGGIHDGKMHDVSGGTFCPGVGFGVRRRGSQ